MPGLNGRIVVAGGAGFIGSHLCEALLQQGLPVLCVDNLQTGAMANIAGLRSHHRQFEFLQHDVCEKLELTGAVSQIYNLACAASPPRYQMDPIHTLLTNVVGTANLLELAERHGARFVQASTSEVYGDPEIHPQPESYRGLVSCTGPRACYDEGKRAAETLCFDYLRLARADVRVARIFNTYGPRMQADDGRIVSNLIVQALSGQAMTIYGDGGQTRSFCYVSDLISGLIALMNVVEIPDGPINLGNAEELTINELAKLVMRAAAPMAKLTRHRLPVDDPRRRRPDLARARALLGWQPEVSLRVGLQHTIDYFSAQVQAEQAAPSALLAAMSDGVEAGSP